MTVGSKTVKKQVEDIVFEGFLEKQSRVFKTWRKRWSVLTDHYLFTFKDPKVYENPTQSVAIDSIIHISKCDEETHREYTFKIQTEDSCFYLGADSNTEREKWMGYIGSIVIKIKNKKDIQE